MSNLKRHPLGVAVFGAILLVVAAQGCNDSNDANPKPPDVDTGGSNATGGAGSTSKAGNTSKGGKSGQNNGDAGNTDEGGTVAITGGSGNETSPEGGAGGEGGSGDIPPIPACTLPEHGADGCFNCPKDSEAAQWLNRCATGDCEPFDNHARLQLLKQDGSVPPLPN